MVIPLYNSLIDHIEDWVDNAQDDDQESDAVEGEFTRKCPEIKFLDIKLNWKLNWIPRSKAKTHQEVTQ